MNIERAFVIIVCGCGGAPFTAAILEDPTGRSISDGNETAPDAAAETGGECLRCSDVEGGDEDAPIEAAAQADSGLTEASPPAPVEASLPEVSLPETAPAPSCDTNPGLPWGCGGCSVDAVSCVLVCHSCTASDGHLFLWPSLQLPCPSNEYIAVDNNGRLICR